MGVSNLKWETEIFEFQQLRIPDRTPVETKPDPYTRFQDLISQVAQLTVAVSQVHQVVAGFAFTRAAPAADLAGVADEIRRLNTRLDALESRAPGGTTKG